MNGCIITGGATFAGFVETVGSNLYAFDDGSAELTRRYQGPPANVDAFLNAFPSGTPDLEFPELTRNARTGVRYDGGWAFVDLTFGGPSFADPGLRPFRVIKDFAERTVQLDLSPGFTGLDERQRIDFKYQTIVHTVEWTAASDPGDASKKSSAQLPSNPVDAVHITNADPVVPLNPDQYYGGGLNQPTGKSPILTSPDAFNVYYQPIDFRRSKDRGDYWQISESWAAIITSPPESP